MTGCSWFWCPGKILLIIYHMGCRFPLLASPGISLLLSCPVPWVAVLRLFSVASLPPTPSLGLLWTLPVFLPRCGFRCGSCVSVAPLRFLSCWFLFRVSPPFCLTCRLLTCPTPWLGLSSNLLHPGLIAVCPSYVVILATLLCSELTFLGAFPFGQQSQGGHMLLLDNDHDRPP